MFTWESVESLLLIGLIAAAIICYGIVLAQKEDHDGDFRGKS
jgi:hypothetical protein